MTETLNLDEVFDRDEVRIEGNTYQLRNAEEFGVLDDYRLRVLIEQISKHSTTATKTEEDAEKASRMLRELAGMIMLDAPDEIPDWACAKLFQFWMGRSAEKAKAARADGPPPKGRRTGESSSRGSKPSTAATPRRGGTRSRSGS